MASGICGDISRGIAHTCLSRHFPHTIFLQRHSHAMRCTIFSLVLHTQHFLEGMVYRIFFYNRGNVFFLCTKYILPCRTKPRARCRSIYRHVRVHDDLFLQHAFQSISLPFVVVQRFNGTNGLPSHSCGIFHFSRLLLSAFFGLAQQSGNFFSAITSAHPVYRYPRFLHPPQRNVFVARRR